VLHEVPEARFVVVGAEPRRELRALESESIEITGWRDELAPFFLDASIFVAPLLHGAGLKFKVPQAMLYGLPVVTTAVGAEGIIETEGTGVFAAVSNNPDDLASAIVRLLRSPTEAMAIGARARAWALQRFSFERRIEAQVAVYGELIASADEAGGSV
jgi:glycosyltransferase involved in cell wall biosynthesis